jgi:hypothetical protein
MSSIDVFLGNSVLTLSGAAILATYTTGSVFQAGAAGVIGLQLWATITTDGASAINTVTFSLETSNDNLVWSPTLAIPHEGGGSQTLEPAFAGLAVGATVVKRISVPPYFTGAAKFFRLKGKANAAGTGTDAIGVVGTAW